MKAKQEKDSSRREFVKKGAMAAAAFTIVPRHVLGKGFNAPSDTLYIASVGIGGKGNDDINKFVQSGKAKPAFLCDVDQAYAGKVFKQYSQAKVYENWVEMLDKENKNFDAVHIATPDHTHAVVGSAAMQLKKHTWIQKPMAHDVYEARMLANMGKKNKVQTQMGNQGSSSDGVRQLMEWYDAGVIGDVTEVYCWTNRPMGWWPQGNGLKWPAQSTTPPSTLNWDLWQGTAPAKPYPIGPDQPGGVKVLPFNWRGWWDYGTGVLGDMGAHILMGPMMVLDLKYVAKVQTSVSGGGSLETGPNANYTVMTFPKTSKTSGPVRVHWMDGGLIPPRPEELDPAEQFGSGDGGMLFIGTKGKMMAGCYASRARLLPTSRMDEVKVPVKYPRVKGGEQGHYAQWVEACLAGYGNMETSSPFEKAALLTEAMLMCNLAIRGINVPKMAAAVAGVVPGAAAPAGRGGGAGYPARYLDLIYDAANLKVSNCDEVNQFVKREYRAPYKLSGV